MARPPNSYAWALHTGASPIPLSQLSEEAYRGFEYAEQLANDARIRSEGNLRNHTGLAPLTIAELAADDGITAATARRRITAARRQLFGDLSDSAIYKRLSRERQRRTRRRRPCDHPNCDQLLAGNVHANRRYCSKHSAPAERVRRHRQGTN